MWKWYPYHDKDCPDSGIHINGKARPSKPKGTIHDGRTLQLPPEEKKNRQKIGTVERKTAERNDGIECGRATDVDEADEHADDGNEDE